MGEGDGSGRQYRGRTGRYLTKYGIGSRSQISEANLSEWRANIFSVHISIGKNQVILVESKW